MLDKGSVLDGFLSSVMHKAQRTTKDHAEHWTFKKQLMSLYLSRLT